MLPRPTAGYSGTPLANKLGIRADFAVATAHAPDTFEALLAPLPAGAVVRDGLDAAFDVGVLFSVERRRLESELASAAANMGRGGLWIAWPKRASGVPTDITEDVVRSVALPLGLVDVKVCAIDSTWSGLRLFWRRR
jgi:DNA-binding transcriptional LysR family regulator